MSPTAPATTITPTLRRRRGLTEQAAVAAERYAIPAAAPAPLSTTTVVVAESVVLPTLSVARATMV